MQDYVNCFHIICQRYHIFEKMFITQVSSSATLLESMDSFGEKVTASLPRNSSVKISKVNIGI